MVTAYDCIPHTVQMARDCARDSKRRHRITIHKLDGGGGILIVTEIPTRLDAIRGWFRR